MGESILRSAEKRQRVACEKPHGLATARNRNVHLRTLVGAKRPNDLENDVRGTGVVFGRTDVRQPIARGGLNHTDRVFGKSDPPFEPVVAAKRVKASVLGVEQIAHGPIAAVLGRDEIHLGRKLSFRKKRPEGFRHDLRGHSGDGQQNATRVAFGGHARTFSRKSPLRRSSSRHTSFPATTSIRRDFARLSAASGSGRYETMTGRTVFPKSFPSALSL